MCEIKNTDERESLKWLGVFIKNIKVNARMKCKKQKGICFILIILMVCSGVCFENTMISSQLLSKNSNKMNSDRIVAYVSMVELEVCTVEMLGIRNGINIRTSLRHGISRKKAGGIEFICMCFQSFSGAKRKWQLQLGIFDVLKGTKENIVLNYIHESDGKKRI